MKQVKIFLLSPPMEIVCCVGIVIMALFPIIGNALTYGTELSRRWFQAGTLAFAGILLTAGLPWLLQHQIRLRRLSLQLPNRFFLFFIAFVLVSLVINWFQLDNGSILKTFVLLILFLLWTYFSLVATTNFKAIKGDEESAESKSPPTNDERRIFIFGATVFALGLVLAALGWWRGPEIGQAHLAFGGSTIMCGMVAVTIYFVLLFACPQPISLIFSLPFGYIAFLSTSRVVWLTFLAFYALLAFHIIKGKNLPSKHTLLKILAPPLVLFFIVVCPIAIKSPLYPYNATQEDPLIVPYRIDQLWTRASRFVMIIPLAWRSNLQKKLLDSDLDLSKFGEKFIGILGMGNYRPGRLELLGDSFSLISKRPTGYWPVPYEKLASINCSPGRRCRYSHNLFFDSAFYFGWIPALVFLLSFVKFGIRSAFMSQKSMDLFGKTVLICFLGTATYTQASGDIIESIPSLFFAVLWFFHQGRANATEKTTS